MRWLIPLLMLLLVACVPAPSPRQAHVALPTELPPQSTVRVELLPNGTPEANPTMTLKIKLYDAATEDEITGIVYWWPYAEWMGYNGDDVVGFDIHGIDLQLGAQEDGWLAVVSPGYRPARFQVRYRIETSRYAEMPIWMHKVEEDGPEDGEL